MNSVKFWRIACGVLIGAAIMGSLHAYEQGKRDFDQQAWEDGRIYGRMHDNQHGSVNAQGNLPYTQGSLDAEARMQFEAVGRGFAEWADFHGQPGFRWKGDTQTFPKAEPQKVEK